MTDGGESECNEETIDSEQKVEWVATMKDEMKSLLNNHTFELVKLPKSKRALKNQWVYRVKNEENTSRP